MVRVQRSSLPARRAALLCASGIAWIVVACGSSGSTGTGSKPIDCKDDVDCPDGLLCAGHICKALSTADAGGSSNAGTGGHRSTGTCGNGVVDGTESCDGTDLNGETCATVTSGVSTGTLGCTSTCAFDLRGCSSSSGAGGSVGGGFGAGGVIYGSGGVIYGAGGSVGGAFGGGGATFGSGGSAGSCTLAGYSCVTTSDCCQTDPSTLYGETCMTTDFLCHALCIDGTECASGCCAPVPGEAVFGACSAPEYCVSAGGSGAGGAP